MRDFLKKYALVLLIGGIFEAVAVSLWLTKHNLFIFSTLAILESHYLSEFFCLEENIPMPAVWYSFLWGCICLFI